MSKLLNALSGVFGLVLLLSSGSQENVALMAAQGLLGLFLVGIAALLARSSSD